MHFLSRHPQVRRAHAAALAAAAMASLTLAACSTTTAAGTSDASPASASVTASSQASSASSQAAASLAAAPSNASPSDSVPSKAQSGAQATHYPLHLDNCGTDVTFTAPPKRVVAIKSTSIEMMFALGLADKVVGVAYPDGPYATAWAPATPPPVISAKVPGEEATLALSPDLIYAGWESNVSSDGVGDRAQLAKLGVSTFVSPAACQEPKYQPKPLTWDDIFTETDQMGQIFDVQPAAEALVAKQRAELAAVKPDGRHLTALWYSSGSKTPYVGAGIGAPELVMKTVGLTNIAANVPMTWSSLSWEAIIAANPDVIVLVDSSWGSTKKKIAQLEGNPATATLTAVKEHHYLVIPFATSEAGVRSVEAVQTLADQLAKLNLS